MSIRRAAGCRLGRLLLVTWATLATAAMHPERAWADVPPLVPLPDFSNLTFPWGALVVVYAFVVVVIGGVFAWVKLRHMARDSRRVEQNRARILEPDPVTAALRVLRREQGTRDDFVDFEVLPPPPDGASEGTFIWFICATHEKAGRFRREKLGPLVEELRASLATAGLPAAECSSLRADVTSLEEIAAGRAPFDYVR